MVVNGYATVQREGFTVPLIGIPEDAVLTECECCGEMVGITDTMITDNGALCPKCRKHDGVDVYKSTDS